MNNRTNRGEIIVNPEIVEAGFIYLIEQFDEYLKEHPMNLTDTLMTVHNFHRLMVENIAREAESVVPKQQVYRMADMTWRGTMRELRRSALRPQ